MFSTTCTDSKVSDNLSTIVYSTIKPGPFQIQLDRDAVVDNDGINYHPAIDPSGKYLVYTSEIEGTPALYVKNLQQPDELPQRLLEGQFMQDKATFSSDGRTLYFVASRDGVTDIYSLPFQPEITTRAADAENVTKGLGGFSPAISPCGQWMAFSSNRHCVPPFASGPILPANYKAGNVYLMKLDGSYLERINASDDWQGAPCWSPDGSMIYFYATISGKTQLHCCHVDSLQVEAVKGLEEHEILSSSFKPDGRLAFIEKDGDRSFIASIDPRKDDLDYRLENPHLSLDFAIHPNGSIFSSSLHASDEIFGEGPPNDAKQKGQGPFLVDSKEITLQTGQKVNLIGIRGYFPTLVNQKGEIITYKDFQSIHRIKIGEWQPKCLYQFPQGIAGLGLSVSSDGKWAVTAAGRPFDNLGSKHIYLIDLEEGKAKDLTPESLFNDSFPSFTPNGDILFSSSRGTSALGQKNLYLMRREVEEIKLLRLTETEGIDSMPSMSPKGNKIVYISKRGEASNHTFNLYMLKLDKVDNIWRESCLLKSVEPFAHPKFSPDGKSIVCATGMYGLAEETPLVPVEVPQSSGEIIVLNLKSKKVERLTDNMWENSLPHWG